MPADPKGEKRPTELRSRRKGRPEGRPLACDRRSYAAPATSSSARRDSKSARSNATHHYARRLSSNDNLSPRPPARLAS
jgi:hypothetical protein